MTGASDEEAAIQLDVYLDRMLAGDGPDGTSWSPDDVSDIDLGRVAGLVADGSTRFHPSFRFEERLSGRLRELAGSQQRAPAYGYAGQPVARGVVVPFSSGTATDPARSRRVGGVIVGGAIASGVSIASLAGAAALVVWRRARWERLA